MKISQNESFQPVTITLESRGELAVLLGSVGASSFFERQELIKEEFNESIDEKYSNTAHNIYEKLEKIFKATKPQTT